MVWIAQAVLVGERLPVEAFREKNKFKIATITKICFFSVMFTSEAQSLLDSRLLLEWSYELGSACPSFCPSVRMFSWNWLVSFFWNSAWCFEAHVLLCVTQPISSISPENVENGLNKVISFAEIWAKILSINQIGGCLNWIYF